MHSTQTPPARIRALQRQTLATTICCALSVLKRPKGAAAVSCGGSSDNGVSAGSIIWWPPAAATNPVPPPTAYANELPNGTSSPPMSPLPLYQSQAPVAHRSQSPIWESENGAGDAGQVQTREPTVVCPESPGSNQVFYENAVFMCNLFVVMCIVCDLSLCNVPFVRSVR